MGKSTTNGSFFNSYVSLPEAIWQIVSRAAGPLNRPWSNSRIGAPWTQIMRAWEIHTQLPSGNLTVCYWKLPIYSWFTYEKVWFSRPQTVHSSGCWFDTKFLSDPSDPLENKDMDMKTPHAYTWTGFNLGLSSGCLVEVLILVCQMRFFQFFVNDQNRRVWEGWLLAPQTLTVTTCYDRTSCGISNHKHHKPSRLSRVRVGSYLGWFSFSLLCHVMPIKCVQPPWSC